MFETIWYYLYCTIGIRLPRSRKNNSLANKIRCFLVRNYITNMGKNACIQKGAKIARDVSIGNHSGVGINCMVQGGVSIGNDVMMGPEVLIFTVNHAHERTDIPMREQGRENISPVKIGNDVWIGTRAIILPGVTIGDGVVVGAGCVVSKNVPPYSIIVGNPGRVVKSRREP